jgi:DNA-binding response OmpR family regulator
MPLSTQRTDDSKALLQRYAIERDDAVVALYRIAERDGWAIALRAREFQILRLLASAKGEPVNRERFLDEVCEYNAWLTTRTVDNFIAAQRAKLEDDSSAPKHLLTVRGTGYRLQIG